MTGEHHGIALELQKPEVARAPALPSATILNYITRVTTPTRVRVVASRATIVVGSVYLSLSALCAYAIISDLLYFPRSVPVISGHGRLYDWIEYAILNEGPFPFCLGIALTSGVTLLLLAQSLKRGSKVASNFACVFLGPLMFLTFMITVLLLFGAIALGFRLFRDGSGSRWWLLAFIPAFVAATLFLLLKDLGVCLRWIAKNPSTEKERVAFLPGVAKQ